jgi:large subunit ribosomal protein L9
LVYNNHMKVILIEDVNNLGKKGEVKEVAEGYARNFLLPRKLVQVATEKTIKNLELELVRKNETEKKQLEEKLQSVQKIKGKKIIIRSKEKKGKLFGSISARDISRELGKEGVSVDEGKVILKDPIKKIGEYEVRIELAKDVAANITLIVESEG